MLSGGIGPCGDGNDFKGCGVCHRSGPHEGWQIGKYVGVVSKFWGISASGGGRSGSRAVVGGVGIGGHGISQTLPATVEIFFFQGVTKSGHHQPSSSAVGQT